MPKYITQVYLSHNGKILPDGSTVELSEEQADKLGNKVRLSPEEELSGKSYKDLKAEAKAAGVEGYSSMNKEELVKALAKDVDTTPDNGATQAFANVEAVEE